MRRQRVLALLAVATVTSAPTEAFGQVSLGVGAYVEASSTCGNASNSVLMWWNGRYFSQGRMSNVFPHATRNRQRFTGSIIAIAENPPPPPERVTITILSRQSYRWGSVYGSSTFRFCPDRALPGMWRGMTPRQ